MTTSSPRSPLRLLPEPCPPRPARTTKRASSTNCNGARDPRNAPLSGRGLLLVEHAHHAPTPVAVEVHPAAHLGEEGVVRASADVRARVHLRPALAHDDAAGAHQLTAVGLHAEPLPCRIAAVARRAATLLMSHQIPPES